MKRRIVRLGVLFALVALLATPMPSAAGGSRPEGLSSTELQAALAAMSPGERARRHGQFTSDRYTVLTYQRLVQSFDAVTGLPVGEARTLEAADVEPLAATGITNLTLTMSVAFDNDSACCRWDIYDWFDWTGYPPNSARQGKDQLTTAWAHDLALRSDSAYALYTQGGAAVMNRNDMTPNLGTSWEFYECNHSAPGCAYYADWGYLYASIYYTKRRYDPTNVVFKYFHTYEDYNYSISFTRNGPGISITPTSGQTSTAIYATFND